jgi:dihydroflavonol-4-reductase
MPAGDLAPVFLTGATGFIGGRVAIRLVERGRRIRCLVRAPERAGRLAALGAELIVGDVTDSSAMRRGMDGAGAAIHLAGAYRIGRVDADLLERVNVEGTRVFLEAVREAAVPLALHVSSVVALGPVAGGEGDENTSYDGPYPSVYHRTKTAAHRIAQAAQRELPLIIICPAFVYGPGDEGPAAQYIADLLRHRVPGLSTKPTVFSYVHVDDVADGIVSAVEHGTPGSIYVLSGEHLSVNAYTRMIGALAGTRTPRLHFPPFLIRATGTLLDAVSRLTGRQMAISREHADVGARGERWVHSSGRARADLGYSPRPLAEGLPETVEDVKSRLSR